MTDSLTFDLKESNDADLTCFFCCKKGIDREFFYRYDDERGTRHSNFVGVHSKCINNTVYHESKPIETDKLKALLKVMQNSAQTTYNLTLEFGDHKPNCDIWDFKQSGRLIDNDNEENICTCEWSEVKRQLLESKVRKLTKEELDNLIAKYGK